MGLRFTQDAIHILGSLLADEGRVAVTQADATLLAGGNQADVRATQVALQVIGGTDPAARTVLRNTSQSMFVLCTRTPNFKWTEMLIYEVFPTDIGLNSVGAVKFATDVVIVDSGADNRSSRWDQPLMEFDVTYGVRDNIKLQKLVAFFRTVRGRRDSFLFFDWLDHSSLEHATIDAATPDLPSDIDQFIAVGDDSTRTFQLIKTYKSPNDIAELVRPITKPIEGSTVVSLNGVQVFNFTVDKLTGLLTFTPRVTFSGLAGMTINNIVPGASFDIVSPIAIPGFLPGDRIVMNGWSNGINIISEAQNLATVASVSGDNKTIHMSTGLNTFLAEAGTNGVNISVHSAPAGGVEIRAGFEFYVPVRFDTDRLPITLEEYGVGGAADVKLIEVRPQDV